MVDTSNSEASNGDGTDTPTLEDETIDNQTADTPITEDDETIESPTEFEGTFSTNEPTTDNPAAEDESTDSEVSTNDTVPISEATDIPQIMVKLPILPPWKMRQQFNRLLRPQQMEVTML